MSTKATNNFDFNNLQALNMRLQNLATPSGSPTPGLVYFDTALNQFGIRLNGAWLYLGATVGTVTSVSVAAANGFGGTVSNSGTTPSITITTSVTGLLKGNATGVVAAVAGTDFLAPAGDGSGLTNLNGSAVATGTVPAARLPVLNALTAPTGSLPMNGQKITGMADGTAATDAASFGQVSTLLQGLTPKPGATVATTAALPACTYANGTSGVGATLTGNANTALTVDSYATAAGDVVLVKNEVAGANNGLYTVTQPGSGATPFILTRHTSMDTTAEFTRSSIVVEDAGTTNANSFWVCTNSANPTVGTTAITFNQLNGATQLIGSGSISITGNTLTVNSAWTGQIAITTVGTITTGTWQATAVAVLFGGTGATTAAAARTNLGAPGKYSALIGDGSTNPIVITQATHGCAADMTNTVQLVEVATGAYVIPDVTTGSTGTISIAFGVTPTTSQYRVIIMG